MQAVFKISKSGKDGVQIIPEVKVALSVAESLGKRLKGMAWIDYNPDHTFVAVHHNTSDPELQKEVLDTMASFFRDRGRCP